MISKHSLDKEEVLKGMKMVNEVVCSTAGPLGREVFLNFEKHAKIIKDGVNIAKFFAFPDPLNDLGRKIIVAAAKSAVHETGDGTTTCVGLTYALCNSGYEAKDVHEYSRGMEAAKDDIVEIIKENARKIVEDDGSVNRELMRYVSNIACNGHEVSDMIADLVSDIGPDGIINVEKSLTPDTYTKKEMGFKLDWGVANPNFYNTQGGVALDNPVVVVADEELTNFSNHLEAIWRHWLSSYWKKGVGGRPLLIFARNLDDEAQRYILSNYREYPIVVCKIPGSAFWVDEQLNDIAVATKSGRVWGKGKRGKHLKEFDGVFGSVQRFEATMQKCFMILDKDVDMSGLNAELKQQLKGENDKNRVDWLKERISRNSGGFGVISVGGKTELDRDSLYEIVDDARKACMAAYEFGIVPGGGRMLEVAFDELSGGNFVGPDFDAGYRTVLGCLHIPGANIRDNAGIQVMDSGAGKKPWTGFDVVTREWVDFFKEGIIDPAAVVISSLENAVSVARRFHTGYHILWHETPDV